MAHADLPDADPRALERDEQLRREERAVRAHAVERDAREDIAAEELEGAVDVAPASAEQDADELVVDPRDEEPAARVGALLTVSHHRVDAVAGRDESRKIAKIELPVSVGEEDRGLRRREESRTQGAAVPSARPVVDDADAAVARGELVRDRAGAVGTP